MTVTVVDYPSKLPAKCSKCSSPYSRDGRKYVDMNIDVRRYGRIYICTLCFNEIALKLGYQSEEIVHIQADILAARGERIAYLEDENDRLNTIIAGGLSFVRAMDERAPSGQNGNVDAPTGEGSTTVDSGRTDTESGVHSAEAERIASIRESGSTEQSEVSGSTDLSTPIKINL